MKFKRKDRVVAIKEMYDHAYDIRIKVGDAGTYFRDSSINDKCCRVEFDDKHTDTYCDKDAIELEQVFNSPLYRALS